ncbi:MAG: 6-bladed beta-propeller, partial [Tannerellaceae bacterium]
MKTLCIALLASISIASLQAKDGLKTIEIVPSKIETGDLKLSNLITSIEYIPLETTDECLIGNYISIYDLSDKHIVVFCPQAKSVYLFDRKGKFLRTISRHGQGPEEFITVKKLTLDEQANQVLLIDLEGVKIFDLNGKYQRTSSVRNGSNVALLLSPTRYLWASPASIEGNSIIPVYSFFDISGSKGKPLYSAVASTPLYKDVEAGNVSYIGLSKPFSYYIHNNEVYVKENTLNDTLYAFRDNKAMEPVCIITAGGLNYTAEMRKDYNEFSRNRDTHVGFMNAFETNQYQFLTFLYRKKVNTCYIDKGTNKVTAFRSADGIPNDYNGGFDFSLLNVRQDNNVWTTVYNAERFAERKDLSTIKPVGPKAAVDRFKSLCNTLA